MTEEPRHQNAPEAEEASGYAFKLPNRVLTPPEALELPFPEPNEVLDFAQLFGREAPTEIEIGFGKGRFLVASVEAHPEVNYLGIEWSRKFCTWTLKRFIRRTCENVRLINGNASHLVARHLPPESVGAFHIYFPDPWPKKRHQRRRLYAQPGFLDDLARALKPGGMVCSATDFQEYGEQIAGLFAAHEGFETLRDEKRATGEGFTNFEAKYLQEGRLIRDFRFRKV